VDRFGVPNVLELNPLPGIIPDPAMNSCFPKAARAAGLSYDELIQEVARIAWLRLTGRELHADHAPALSRHSPASLSQPAPPAAIVRSAGEDASAGLDRGLVVSDRKALRAGVVAMTEQFDEVLVQEYVPWRELNVGFVGTRVVPLAEIDFSTMPAGSWPILTYAAKWDSGSPDDLGSVPVCPASVPQKLAERLV